MSFSCILYPAVGSSCTQLLGSVVPCPLGSPPTHSLGTIVLLRWVQLYPFVGYKIVYEQSRGLLKRLYPEPEGAAAVVHTDATTEEVQAVRVVAAPRGSTRRPTPAVAANAGQLTSAVLTQGGQVEVVACVSCRRETGVVDTTIIVAVVLVCCAHVGCTVGR